jgi:hypothetical protein
MAVGAHVLDWMYVLLFVREPYSMMICTAAYANMSQSSLAPSAMLLLSAQGGALANEAALLFNPALAPSHHQHQSQSQSLANPAPPQSESESLPLQGSSHL